MNLGLTLSLGSRRAGGGTPAPVKTYELDAIDNVFSACFLKQVTALWAGALVRLRRSTDNIEQDFFAADDQWIDTAEITTWLAGATAHVVRVYDQFGFGRDVFQSSASLQPTLDMSGTRPSFVMNGTRRMGYAVSGVGSVTGMFRNVSAASSIAIRKYDSLAAPGSMLAIGTGTTGTRVHIFSLNTGPVFQAGGRRLDADSSQNTTGLAANTNWGVQITRYDWAGAKLFNAVDGASEVRDPFQTAGSISNTVPTHATLGHNNGATIMNGKFVGVALVNDLITDAEVPGLMTSLAALEPA